jgi:urease accessory protein
MGTGLRAAARVEVAAGGRCTVLRSAPPLTFRVTPDGLRLVGTAAGPVGGDRLRLDLRVAEGGSLTVRGVAASLVHPGPAGEPSSLDIEVDVGAGATLRWLAMPTVLIRGCDHTVTTTIRLGVGARLLWRDEVVLGREHEPTGSLRQRLRIDRDGRPLLRNELTVGPRWPGSLGPAGIDGARAVGTVVAVGEPCAAATVGGVHLAVLPLGDDASLVTATAPSASLLARSLPSGHPDVRGPGATATRTGS